MNPLPQPADCRAFAAAATKATTRTYPTLESTGITTAMLGEMLRLSIEDPGIPGGEEFRRWWPNVGGRGGFARGTGDIDFVDWAQPGYGNVPPGIRLDTPPTASVRLIAGGQVQTWLLWEVPKGTVYVLVGPGEFTGEPFPVRNPGFIPNSLRIDTELKTLLKAAAGVWQARGREPGGPSIGLGAGGPAL